MAREGKGGERTEEVRPLPYDKRKLGAYGTDLPDP